MSVIFSLIFGGLSSFLKSIPTIVWEILGVFALVCLILTGAFYGGYEYRSAQDARAQLAQAVKQNDANVKDIQTRDQHRVLVYVRDEASIQKLENERDALQQKVARLQEEAKNYVPEHNVGDTLSVGAVRVLNDAADGINDAAISGSTPTATGASSQDSAPSTLTWRDFTSDEIALRGQVNGWRNQCNLLIDWVQNNVVNAQAEAAKPKKAETSQNDPVQ